jgi:hypothetical protein
VGKLLLVLLLYANGIPPGAKIIHPLQFSSGGAPTYQSNAKVKEYPSTQQSVNGGWQAPPKEPGKPVTPLSLYISDAPLQK